MLELRYKKVGDIMLIIYTWRQAVYRGELINYLVSPYGDIATMDTKPLREFSNNRNYRMVSIVNNSGKRLIALVHRIVAETYIDNPNGYPIVNHIDGDKSNCAINNLEWCTYSYNNKHAYDLGLRRHFKGVDSNFAKYSEEDVKAICRELCYEQSVADISAKLSLPVSLIASIKGRMSWTHISKDYKFVDSKYYTKKCMRDKIGYYWEQGKSVEDICDILGWPSDGKYNSKYKRRVRKAIKKYVKERSTTIHLST
jgi:hypothetical protein